MMTLVKVSEIKPGDKFTIMGMDLFVSYITCTGDTFRVDFENETTINNPFLTNIIVSCTFGKDTWVNKE